MKIRIVEAKEKWDILKQVMIEKGYKLCQFQYSWDDEQGFNAWFWKEGKSNLQVITHIKEIEDDIVNSNLI